MKNIYIIGGTMGVGKTTICQKLKLKLANSVFLDGDWCWDMNPFQVTEETKKMVIDNICYQLNNFIGCSVYENIIFCWVMHEQSIIDQLLARINTDNLNVKVISLVCNEKALIKRLQKDIDQGIRTEDVLTRSLARIKLYEKLDTIKIDVSNLSVDEVVAKICAL